MEIYAAVVCSGAPTSASLYFNLPTGYTIDTASLPSATSFVTTLGNGGALDTGTKEWAGITVVLGSTTSRLQLYSPDGATDGSVTQAAPFTFGTGDSVSFHAMVPVAEWAGNGVVNLGQNDAEYAYNTDTSDASNTTAFGYGAQGQAFPGSAFTAVRDKRVRFTTPIQPTDIITLEVNISGFGWNELDGDGPVGSTNISSVSTQNSVYYGVGIKLAVNATDVDVRFGQYSFASGSAYGAAGNAWSGTTATSKWRLKKVASGQAVGFGQVAQNTSGLVKSAGQLMATNTNDSAITGYVGEVLMQSRVRSSATSLTTGTAANVTSTALTLSAGDWDVIGAIGFQLAATTAITRIIGSISTTSATLPGLDTIAVQDATGQMRAQSTFAAMVPVNDTSIAIPRTRISLATSTTFYLVASADFTVSTMAVYGSIVARRVR